MSIWSADIKSSILKLIYGEFPDLKKIRIFETFNNRRPNQQSPDRYDFRLRLPGYQKSIVLKASHDQSDKEISDQVTERIKQSVFPWIKEILALEEAKSKTVPSKT